MPKTELNNINWSKNESLYKAEIIPKNKPLFVKKEIDKSLKKSKYFNKKDFSLARKAIAEMKKAKWQVSLKTAKKAKDKSIYNFTNRQSQQLFSSSG